MKLSDIDLFRESVYHLARSWDCLRELEEQTGQEWPMSVVEAAAADVEMPATLGSAHRVVTPEAFAEVLRKRS